ncbi:MAG: type IX secretion system membrane protein PorP/SprF [Sphingobacteriaceae bacterium]|nr:MAG: type IX secretion system membrane protein PorP/SprF [Sphingobacteriaceae bacterium]
MNKLPTVFILLFCLCASRLSAQIDPHFSQYYAYPLWLNPALTGVMNGDVRITANFRSQWGTIDNPYSSTALSADFRPTPKIGLGLNIINQSAGNAGYNYLGGYGSASYGIIVSNDGYQHINFGMQAGFINHRFDMNKFQFGSQYDPATGYNAGLPSFENFQSVNSTVFDANAGLFYYDGNPLKTANFFGGFSVNHIVPAKDPFGTNNNTKIPMRYDVHAGARIQVSEYFSVTPHGLYVQQQNNKILALGAYARFQVKSEDGLLLGAMYRLHDANVVTAGYTFRNFVLGASYDINSSSLQRATQGLGGLELSLYYVFRKRIQEPEEVCPRL